MAITAILDAIASTHESPTLRDQRISAAWRIGATAEELHTATGLSGTELREIVTAQGADPTSSARGWSGMRRTRRGRRWP